MRDGGRTVDRLLEELRINTDCGTSRLRAKRTKARGLPVSRSPLSLPCDTCAPRKQSREQYLRLLAMLTIMVSLRMSDRVKSVTASG
jgi:hypothetical protein